MKSNETVVLSNAERQAKFKANQAFKGLPIDVQHTIDRLCPDDDPERKRRISAAVRYQSLFGDRVHPGIDFDRDYRNAG